MSRVMRVEGSWIERGRVEFWCEGFDEKQIEERSRGG